MDANVGLDIMNVGTLLSTNPELLLPPIALGIGKAVKKSLFPDKLIPSIVTLATGCVGFIILHTDLNSFITGCVYGLLTVGGHQGIKQLTKDSKEGSN